MFGAYEWSANCILAYIINQFVSNLARNTIVLYLAYVNGVNVRIIYYDVVNEHLPIAAFVTGIIFLVLIQIIVCLYCLTLKGFFVLA